MICLTSPVDGHADLDWIGHFVDSECCNPRSFCPEEPESMGSVITRSEEAAKSVVFMEFAFVKPEDEGIRLSTLRDARSFTTRSVHSSLSV
jgi:hypothetical protein